MTTKSTNATANAIKSGEAPTTMNKAATEKANALMRTYAKCIEEKNRLQALIAEQMKKNSETMKEAEEGLLLLGERYKQVFDSKGNLHLEDGYLHIAKNTVVETTKKFNPTEFLGQFPDLIEVKLKTGEVKKSWLNSDENKELKALGVRVDTIDKMEVIVNKKV